MELKVTISKEKSKEFGKIIKIVYPDDCKVYFSKKGTHIVLSKELTKKYYDKKPEQIEVLFNKDETNALIEVLAKIDLDTGKIQGKGD